MNQGEWSQSTTATSVTTPPQESGKHAFTVRAIDRDANLSQTDSFTFQIDLERPEVQISSPKDQTIVSGREGQIVIRGAVNDDDLKLFRVEFSPLTLPLRFQLIDQAEVEVERDRPLALWRTQDLGEKQYVVRLLAQDDLGHQKSDQIQVTLDNTLPQVDITAPKNRGNVLQQVNILAITSDQNLDSYRLDYTTDLATNEWLQIYVQGGLYQKNESQRVKPLQLIQDEVNQDWEIPISAGSV